jgi:hypothetical protein
MNNFRDRHRDDMNALPPGLRDMFHRGVLERVGVIESCAVALRMGTLDLESRSRAERAAHKIADAAKILGYWDANQMACEAQAAFDGNDPIPPNVVVRLLEIATALREEFSRGID